MTEEGYNQIGFIYSGSSFSDFNDPNSANSTSAYGINGNGDVVGYYYNGNTNNDNGFIATPSAAPPAPAANVPFEFSPEQGFMLGIPLFIGLRYLKKKRA